MGISTKLRYAALDDLYLDPKNPRLGRHYANVNSSQEEILEVMDAWTLDELAISYVESGGFWTYEALLVVKEVLDDKQRLVVVEGNRRLAALIYLRRAVNGEQVSQEWSSLVKNFNVPDGFFKKLFNEIPYILVDTRQEIEAFLGFRHVTGIKQWPSEQKAQYIVRLIDEQKMNYEEVMRKIGSRTSTVKQHYISYRLLLQMENELEDFSIEDAKGRFSVMYLSLRTQGVRKYLHIDMFGDPSDVQRPVPKEHLDALANFARWLFGSKQHNQDPLFNDSRRVNEFSQILASPEAVEYLKGQKNPDFDYAFQLAGGEEYHLVQLLSKATSNVGSVLKRVDDYTDSENIQEKAEILGIKFQQLVNVLPNVGQRLREQGKEN